MKQTWGARLAGAALILAAGGGALAAGFDQEHESRILSDRWYLSLGSSSTDFKTRGAIGFGSVVGTFIRLEDDLDLDSQKSSFRFNGCYSFGPKQQIDFTFGKVNRSGRIVLDKEIQVGDNGDEIIFQVGADLDSKFDTDSAKVFYKYSFINNGKTQAGIGVGLSVFDYRLEFEGTAVVNPAPTRGGMLETHHVSENVLAPIPSLLLFIHHAFKPNLVFRATAGFFDLDVSDFDGRLVETRGTIDWFFTRHIGIGGGVEGSDINFADNGTDPLLLQIQGSSWIFYLSGAF